LIDILAAAKLLAPRGSRGVPLGRYLPKDGIDGSWTISTAQDNGQRTSWMYNDRPSRINTYGNSFTQCHQVSDGETWQEYLAAHLGEPALLDRPLRAGWQPLLRLQPQGHGGRLARSEAPHISRRRAFERRLLRLPARLGDRTLIPPRAASSQLPQETV
jgi:hypothetical protein